MNVHDSVVLVTGASSGIGRATAVALAKSGAHVIITARRAERLDELLTKLADYPGLAMAIPGDIQDTNFGRLLIQQVISEYGRLDVLINNAGIGHKSTLASMPMTDMAVIFNTNVLGIMALTQAAVSHMKGQGHGQIINISSIVGQRPLPLSGAYCASKAALNFLSRSLRMELRPFNITVTTIYPGLTRTEFGQSKLGNPGPNRNWLKGMPAERVSKAIIKAMRNGRTEVYVTWYDWLFSHMNRLWPRTIDWIVSRGIQLFQEPTTPSEIAQS